LYLSKYRRSSSSPFQLAWQQGQGLNNCLNGFRCNIKKICKKKNFEIFFMDKIKLFFVGSGQNVFCGGPKKIIFGEHILCIGGSSNIL